MQIATLGPVPMAIEQLPWPGDHYRFSWETQPLFAIDGLLAIEPLANDRQREQLRLAARSGRPVVMVGGSRSSFPPEGQIKYVNQLTLRSLPPVLEWYASSSRTNYLPIDCNFYDEFEAAIVTRKMVLLEYLDITGQRQKLSTRLTDTKTYRTEEYLQLASGEWMRFDRVYAVNGVPAGDSCRF
jgi:Rho-binding antiterminator